MGLHESLDHKEVGTTPKLWKLLVVTLSDNSLRISIAVGEHDPWLTNYYATKCVLSQAGLGVDRPGKCSHLCRGFADAFKASVLQELPACINTKKENQSQLIEHQGGAGLQSVGG